MYCAYKEKMVVFFFIFYFDPSISFIYIVHCLPQKEVFYTYAYSHICMKTDKPEVSLLYTRKITYVVVSDAYNLWINFRIILFFLCKNICIKKNTKETHFLFNYIFEKPRWSLSNPYLTKKEPQTNNRIACCNFSYNVDPVSQISSFIIPMDCSVTRTNTHKIACIAFIK